MNKEEIIRYLEMKMIYGTDDLSDKNKLIEVEIMENKGVHIYNKMLLDLRNRIVKEQEEEEDIYKELGRRLLNKSEVIELAICFNEYTNEMEYELNNQFERYNDEFERHYVSKEEYYVLKELLDMDELRGLNKEETKAERKKEANE